MIDILSHITVTACDQVALICAGFFKKTSLTYYNFVRIYQDGARLSFSNDRLWMEYFYTNISKHRVIFEKHPEIGETRYVLWDAIDDIGNDSLMVIAKEQYNIAHGITIMAAYPGYLELQYFATHHNNKKINNFYINHLPLLEEFSLYFKDVSHNLITQGEKERFSIAQEMIEAISDNGKHYHPAIDTDIKVKRYFLGGDNRHVYLTQREADCLFCLYHGMTAKMTARRFNISFRTVQDYLAAARLKLNCHSKKDILDCLHNSGFEAISTVIAHQLNK